MHNDLQNNDVRCWFAPEDMKGGRKIHDQLDDAIKLHDKLLVILSKSSMESAWVREEIRRAREREKETGKQKLFPISLVDYNHVKTWQLRTSGPEDLADEIRQYYIPEFQGWSDETTYGTALGRLLKDLKDDEPGEG